MYIGSDWDQNFKTTTGGFFDWFTPSPKEAIAPVSAETLKYDESAVALYEYQLDMIIPGLPTSNAWITLNRVKPGGNIYAIIFNPGNISRTKEGIAIVYDTGTSSIAEARRDLEQKLSQGKQVKKFIKLR